MDQLVLRALIAEPCFSRKPENRAQHEYAGVTSSGKPPVLRGAPDDVLRVAELPFLPDDATEERTHFPGER